MRRTLLQALAAAAAVAAGSADAADNDALNQSVWLRVGAFHPSITSTAQVDHPGTGAPGTAIDFEHDLGLKDRKTMPTLLLGARFAGAWRAEFEYFQLKRDSVTTLGQILNFDDSTFPIQASLATKFDSSVYRASIGYSFVQTPTVELGAVFGVHVTRFDIVLEGNVSAAGQPLVVQREQQDKTVPLPTLGVYGAWAIAPGWAASARADIFKLKRGQYDGRLINGQVNLIWRATGNLGIGLGYRYDDYKVSAERSDFRGHVDYKFRGPQMFLEAGF